MTYSVGKNATIDEMHPSFSVQSTFRQYIPSKPITYEIKLLYIILRESKIADTHHLELYTGSQLEGTFKVSNKPTDIVK